MPTEAPQIDATPCDLHAFVRQATALFNEFDTAGREGEAAIRTHHPVPGQGKTCVGLAQHSTDHAAHDALHHGGGYLGALDLRDPVEMLADGTL